MKFKSARKMLQYIQNHGDIWSPSLGMYVFRYGDMGSICCYNIEEEEANEISKWANEEGDRWEAYLGIGGTVYDTIEWYKKAINDGTEFNSREVYDHALEFCDKYFSFEWENCYDVK